MADFVSFYLVFFANTTYFVFVEAIKRNPDPFIKYIYADVEINKVFNNFEIDFGD